MAKAALSFAYLFHILAGLDHGVVEVLGELLAGIMTVQDSALISTLCTERPASYALGTRSISVTSPVRLLLLKGGGGRTGAEHLSLWWNEGANQIH